MESSDDDPVGEVPPTLPDRVRRAGRASGVNAQGGLLRPGASTLDYALRGFDVGPSLTVASVERLCEQVGITLVPWQRDYLEREINARRHSGGTQ